MSNKIKSKQKRPAFYINQPFLTRFDFIWDHSIKIVTTKQSDPKNFDQNMITIRLRLINCPQPNVKAKNIYLE